MPMIVVSVLRVIATKARKWFFFFCRQSLVEAAEVGSHLYQRCLCLLALLVYQDAPQVFLLSMFTQLTLLKETAIRDAVCGVPNRLVTPRRQQRWFTSVERDKVLCADPCFKKYHALKYNWNYCSSGRFLQWNTAPNLQNKFFPNIEHFTHSNSIGK